jgi:hypothetical protein
VLSMSSKLEKELAAAADALEALLSLQAGKTSGLQAADIFKRANRLALENSVHFPAPGPVNERRAAACHALQGLVVAIAGNGLGPQEAALTIKAVEAWRDALKNSRGWVRP